METRGAKFYNQITQQRRLDVRSGVEEYVKRQNEAIPGSTLDELWQRAGEALLIMVGR